MGITVPTQSGPSVQSVGIRMPEKQYTDPGFVNIGGAIKAGVETANTYIQAVRDKEKKQADEAAVIEANRKLEKAKTDSLYGPEGAYTKKAENALDVVGTYVPAFEKEADLINESLTEDQRAMFAPTRANAVTQIDRDLNKYEYQERNTHYDNVAKTAVSGFLENAAMASDDPVEVERQLAFADGVITATAARKGVDPAPLIQETRSAAYTNTIGSLLVKNPNDPMPAVNYYNKVSSSMTFEDQMKAQSQLVPLMQYNAGQQGAKQIFNATSEMLNRPTYASPAGKATLAATQRLNFLLESGGRMTAADGGPVMGVPVASKGGEQAIGPMQVMTPAMEDVGRARGVPVDKAKMMTDPVYAKQVGDEYTEILWKKYDGDPILTAAAYNAGMGSVDKALKASGGIMPERVSTLGPQFDGKVMAGTADFATLPLVGDGAGGWKTPPLTTATMPNGQVVLLPAYDKNGQPINNEQAVALAQSTNKSFGVFANQEAAQAYINGPMSDYLREAANARPDYTKLLPHLPSEESRNHVTKAMAIMGEPSEQTVGAPPTGYEAFTTQYALAVKNRPEMPGKERDGYDQYLSRMKADNEATRTAIYAQLDAQVQAGQPPNPEMMAELAPSQRKTLNTLIKSKTSGESIPWSTDSTKMYDEFIRMSPEQQAKVNLLEYKNALPPDQFKTVKTQYDKAASNAPETADEANRKLKANENVIKQGMNTAGIILGDSKAAQEKGNVQKAGMFRNAVDVRVSEFTEKNARPPTTDELSSLVARLNFEYKETGNWFNDEEVAYKITGQKVSDRVPTTEIESINEIPVAHRVQVINHIKKAGRYYLNGKPKPFNGGEPTSAMIIGTYLSTTGAEAQ